MSSQPNSPRLEARITGVLYLLNLLTGVAAMVLISRKHQDAGDALNHVAFVLYTAVTLLLWHLLRGVNPWLAAVTAVVSLLDCRLPLARYENAYPPLHNTSFLFFGIYCLLIAYLIFRSRFMPNIVGALMPCAGICWLTTMSPHLTPAESLSTMRLAIPNRNRTMKRLSRTWVLAHPQSNLSFAAKCGVQAMSMNELW